MRFTVRRMMIAVAILAVACLGGREGWALWLRRGYRNPVSPSRLSATPVGNRAWKLVCGRPTPVSIKYDFKFKNPKPAPGTTCRLLAVVWFEERATGRYVDGYTFDAPLSVGGREACSGTFTWDALVVRPGVYRLHADLYHEAPWGGLKYTGGQAQGCQFTAGTPPRGAAIDSGARP